MCSASVRLFESDATRPPHGLRMQVVVGRRFLPPLQSPPPELVTPSICEKLSASQTAPVGLGRYIVVGLLRQTCRSGRVVSSSGDTACESWSATAALTMQQVKSKRRWLQRAKKANHKPRRADQRTTIDCNLHSTSALLRARAWILPKGTTGVGRRCSPQLTDARDDQQLSQAVHEAALGQRGVE